MKRKILVVDDDIGLAEMITYRLKQEGYQVSTATDGTNGFEAARDEKPDLIILDLMLPGMSGLEVCSQLRHAKSTATIPIIMLTAKKFEIDKVAGLEIGADDYIIKPFSYRELLARVHALLRRSNNEHFTQEHSYLVAGPLHIDLTGRRVICRGQEVELAPKLFDLLEYLVRNRDIVLTRDDLLQNVWGYEYEGGMRTVDVHMRWLREKLEEDPANPRFFQTKLKVGYCFRLDTSLVQ